jgi:hypothetical protein
VWPACWGKDEMPLPGDDTLPDTDDNPLLGSGLSFLKAPSAVIKKGRISEIANWIELKGKSCQPGKIKARFVVKSIDAEIWFYSTKMDF